MTVELSLLLSGISVAFAIFFGISSKNRNDRKDTEQETESIVISKHTLSTLLERNVTWFLSTVSRENMDTHAG